MGLFDWWDYTLVVDWLHEFYHEGEKVAAHIATQAAKLAVWRFPAIVSRRARSPPIEGSI